MNYWTATAETIEANGGRNPSCPTCRKEMVSQDDHGSFICFSCSFGRRSNPIPQVPTEGMSDTKKAEVPTINRLDAPPTKAEQDVIKLFLKGPAAMDGPDYIHALKALDKERGK